MIIHLKTPSLALDQVVCFSSKYLLFKKPIVVVNLPVLSTYRSQKHSPIASAYLLGGFCNLPLSSPDCSLYRKNQYTISLAL